MALTTIPQQLLNDPDDLMSTPGAIQDALDLKAAAADLTAHTGDTANPHGVTKAQVGLSNVDNTSDANKPVSTAQQAVLDLKAATSDLTAHTGNTSNPHGVTKTQVGLGNVDNTSDANKPISTATQSALNLKAAASDLTAHTGNTSNPHGVTKAQVGLSNVDNTADSAKPVSTAQQAAIDVVNTTLVPNNQTGTAYTLVLTDAGKRVAMNNAAANVVTVPPNSSVAFPVNTTLFISQDGAGATSIAAGSGVTINVAEGLNVGGQYKMVSIIKTATNTWMGIGTVA